MSKLTIWTLDWVPQGPRGYVRDLRLRWACAEAGLAYDIRTIAFDDRQINHLARQPFGQVPYLDDGEVQMFESGAALLHIARKSERLMPQDAIGEAQTLQWVIAALNSVELATLPWWFLGMSGTNDESLTQWVASRLEHLEAVLRERQWLAANRFTAADLLMADILRIPKVREFGERPATEAYVSRITDRPAFRKAHADQLAFYTAADEHRSPSW